jgi:hypothetical protein
MDPGTQSSTIPEIYFIFVVTGNAAATSPLAGKPLSPLLFFLWLLFSTLETAKMQHRELQKEFCKHLGHPGHAIICGHRTLNCCPPEPSWS